MVASAAAAADAVASIFSNLNCSLLLLRSSPSVRTSFPTFRLAHALAFGHVRAKNCRKSSISPAKASSSDVESSRVPTRFTPTVKVWIIGQTKEYSNGFPLASDDFCSPQYGRLLPCPTQNGAPRVEHLLVKEDGPVLQVISSSLDLPPTFVSDLIHFGAVYYALICPKPPPTATAGEIKTYKKYTAPAFLKRKSIKGKTFREAQKTFRITSADELVETGTYLRVHVHPKRFPRCYEIDWKSRIIAVTESYVIMDKPAGTSVGGTTDNIEECCATFATRALGLASPLMTTHQIDNCTEGCVVFARTKEYCSVFHGKIREKKVKKLYLALAAAPVPVGIMTHYMRPINMAPRLVSKDMVQGWPLCHLEVLECRKFAWPTSEAQSKYGIEDYGWHYQDFAYECRINLLTGRTHQIRAQLASYGAPIVGDSMYMPAAAAEAVNPGVNPLRNSNNSYASEADKVGAVEEWIKLHGREPAIAIGLQACQISWDDGDYFYEAGSPWWR